MARLSGRVKEASVGSISRVLRKRAAKFGGAKLI